MKIQSKLLIYTIIVNILSIFIGASLDHLLIGDKYITFLEVCSWEVFLFDIGIVYGYLVKSIIIDRENK